MTGADPTPEPQAPGGAAASERIAELLEELERRAPPELWPLMDEVVARLGELYGAGLASVLRHARVAGAEELALARALVEDDLLASLLLLHGLHPSPLAERVASALERARPYLRRHRGDVELVEVADGVVRLRLVGSCDGCSSSGDTVSELLERTLLEAAPEIERVELMPSSPPAHEPAPGLVQIGGARAPAAPPTHQSATRCELCAAPLPARHPHVVDREARALRCACRACALLFERPEAGRYQTVPRRVLLDPAASLAASRLAGLGVPVQLAFLFFHGTARRWFAVYPSPAGPTEAEVDTAAMEALAAECRLVEELAPDVEALLFRGRRGHDELEHYLAPIDDCYELVGLVRRSWRGFDGGDEGKAALDGFFSSLRARSRALPLPSGGLSP